LSPQSPPHRISLVRAVLALALAAVTGVAATACSSSPPSPAAAQAPSAKALDCTAVSDVLSDGPDPDVDPVGYAQAQILPLRQLTLADPAVRQAVGRLDAAYQAFSSSTAAARTQDAAAVSSAQTALNSICPGAAS
jgi:hypothetical protein